MSAFLFLLGLSCVVALALAFTVFHTVCWLFDDDDGCGLRSSFKPTNPRVQLVLDLLECEGWRDDGYRGLFNPTHGVRISDDRPERVSLFLKVGDSDTVQVKLTRREKELICRAVREWCSKVQKAREDEAIAALAASIISKTQQLSGSAKYN